MSKIYEKKDKSLISIMIKHRNNCLIHLVSVRRSVNLLSISSFLLLVVYFNKCLSSLVSIIRR